MKKPPRKSGDRCTPIKMSRDQCHTGKNASRMQQTALNLTTVVTLALLLPQVSQHNLSLAAQAQQVASLFPGVTRDLVSFCSARPSLSIDLAPMIVHVKRNTSFNYKLYLLSNTEHVFQTGQVVPRDDFRIHSFPVKLKQLNEFIPIRDNTLQVYQLTATSGASNRNQQQLVRVPNSSFNPRQFLAQVPMLVEHQTDRVAKRARSTSEASGGAGASPKKVQEDNRRPMTFDVYGGDALPGDESFAHHDVVASAVASDGATPARPQNANEHIHFDRDDQLVLLGGPVNRLARELASRESAPSSAEHERPSTHQHHQLMVTPVGSFSSFHVNSTYLVRKDFDQSQAQVVRILVDAQRFQVNQVHLLSGFDSSATSFEASREIDQSGASTSPELMPPSSEEFAFLSHKLLRDAGTRITSITQIYEDWITRNFYTIVYIQSRPPVAATDDDDDGEHKKGARTSGETTAPPTSSSSSSSSSELTTDRLIFRGSSTVLLGADQLDYHVKASAFVTEKNGLHYYLEFLPSGKFYLGAIDWTKRPFRFIDSRGLPIKQARTLFDNEELLLCPPSVCYSDQPVDEIVSYGRLALSDKFQREASILSRSSTSLSGPVHGAADQPVGGKRVLTLLTRPGGAGERSEDTADEDHELLFVSSKSPAADQRHQVSLRQTPPPSLPHEARTTTSHQSESISLDSIISAVRTRAGGLTTRLHLRDWVWSLPRVTPPAVKSNASSKFAWHFEWAKRNEVKVTQDTYGFALTGHEIDASYRVFNELYLISANRLITINYTLPNETVTSVHPIEEEFPGLSSSLLDPITGAFYDRYSNQLYFFKGDRYVGFDYANKRPLEDFLLPSGADLLGGGGGLPFSGGVSAAGSTSTTRLPALVAAAALGVNSRPLVSSLPVVGILGRQHRVDAIHHDLQDDIVYVISGMKFYTHKASDFKEGAFRSRPSAAGLEQPPMRCINEHFLEGCRFDEAYPNPCTSEQLVDHEQTTGGGGSTTSARLQSNSDGSVEGRGKAGNASQVERENIGNNFSEEQQMKLRSIAARGGSGRLFDFLLENTLIAQGAARAIEPFLAASAAGDSGNGTTPPSMPKEGGSYVMLAQSSSSAQERIVIYLLIAMVLITIMVTVAMIIVILSWSRSERSDSGQSVTAKKGELQEQPHAVSGGQAHLLEERIAYPPAISQYLSNQYHQQRLQQQQRHHRSSRDHYPGVRRSITQMPLPSPPLPTGPKPAARIPFRSYITSGGHELGPLGPHHPEDIIDSSAL